MSLSRGGSQQLAEPESETGTSRLQCNLCTAGMSLTRGGQQLAEPAQTSRPAITGAHTLADLDRVPSRRLHDGHRLTRMISLLHCITTRSSSY